MIANEASRLRQIGRRIQQARRGRGLSQSALAARVGVSQANVSRWEKGIATLGVVELECVAQALCLPALALILGRSNLPDNPTTLTLELAWWGLDLIGQGKEALWAVRDIEEVVVCALTAPEPRVIERLAALFFLQPGIRPAVLWGHAEARRVERRLAWLLDIARFLVTRGVGPSTEALSDGRWERLLDEDRDAWPWDGMGSPALDRSGLGPAWQRWRIDYEGDIHDIEEAVLLILEDRQ